MSVWYPTYSRYHTLLECVGNATRGSTSAISSGRNRIWRQFRVFCLLSVKVCFWYKTHSKTGILASVLYVFILSVPGIQFGVVTVSFEAFSGHKTMMYTLKVGFTILNNLASRFELSLYFTNSVEVLVDSIHRVLSKMM